MNAQTQDQPENRRQQSAADDSGRSNSGGREQPSHEEFETVMEFDPDDWRESAADFE